MWASLALAAGLLAACGDEPRGAGSGAEGPAEAPVAVIEACGTPVLAASAGRPFDVIAVDGLPDGFRPSAAEITRPEGGVDTLLTHVYVSEAGDASLQVPVHPSFDRAGGVISIRIYQGDNACDPVPFTVSALDPAPGTMAEAIELLRAAVDLMASPAGASGDLRRLTADAAEAPGALSLFAVSALWSLPALEELEASLDSGVLGPEAEMMDAVAARIRLPERMRQLAGLVLLGEELAGHLTIGTATDREAARRPATETGEPPVRLASAAPESFGPTPSLLTSSSYRRYVPPAQTPDASPGSDGPRCPAGHSALFEITDPAELDNLMRVQDYAQRFQRGVLEPVPVGGSASGTVFGDIGAMMGFVRLLRNPVASRVAEVWGAFSSVVLNTADAYATLLPGDMVLSVVASPALFAEDSEETGQWTARAVATSQEMRLTREVLERVMTEAFKAGLGDASIGRPLREWVPRSTAEDELVRDIVDRASDEAARRLDSAAKREATDALKGLLDALGGEQGPDWFDIPPGCWVLPDMLAGGGAGGAAAGDEDAPPLLEPAALEGTAIRWSGSQGDRPRIYEPAAVDVSTIRVRTVEDYLRHFLEIPFLLEVYGIPVIDDHANVGTTSAFGGDQAVGSAQVEVRAIDVQVLPSVVRIQPGEPVPFVALVRNAMDTHVLWRTSAGQFEDIVDHQPDRRCPRGSMGTEGTHEAVLITRDVPLSAYPIRVEVESTSDCGIRWQDAPERKGVATVEIADPVMLIDPPHLCLAPGDTMQFHAELLGGSGGIRWSASGGRVDRNGLYRAPGTAGTYEITAASESDGSIRAMSRVEVGGDCCGFGARVSAGPHSGPHVGPAQIWGPALILSDAAGGWELTVEIPAFERGIYDSEMMVVADFPHPYQPGETVAVPADAPEGERAVPATLRIDHAEGDFRLGRGEGSIQGRVSGRAGWRDLNGVDVYFDVDAWFKAVKFGVGRGSRAQACRVSWGEETTEAMMRRLDLGNRP